MNNAVYRQHLPRLRSHLPHSVAVFPGQYRVLSNLLKTAYGRHISQCFSLFYGAFGDLYKLALSFTACPLK